MVVTSEHEGDRRLDSGEFNPLTKSADNCSVEEDDLRKELARLEAEEARLSAERDRLHHQLDFGFATGTTRAREREVSAERRELHRRIDALRKLLRAEQVS